MYENISEFSLHNIFTVIYFQDSCNSGITAKQPKYKHKCLINLIIELVLNVMLSVQIYRQINGNYYELNINIDGVSFIFSLIVNFL